MLADSELLRMLNRLPSSPGVAKLVESASLAGRHAEAATASIREQLQSAGSGTTATLNNALLAKWRAFEPDFNTAVTALVGGRG